MQRALVLLTSHLESFRKRYAYHLRQWQLDRRSVASHHRGLHDKHSVPIHIVIQPASTADKVLCLVVCYGIHYDGRVIWCYSDMHSSVNRYRPRRVWIKIIWLLTNSWSLLGVITSPMRQSWWQQDWRHCKISCPSRGRHCLVMSPDSTPMFLHTKPYGCRWTFPLIGSPTSDGDGPMVDHERPGVARSGLTSECHLVTTGIFVYTIATVEWGDSP